MPNDAKPWVGCYKVNSGLGPRKVKLKYNKFSSFYKLLIKNALIHKYYKS